MVNHKGFGRFRSGKLPADEAVGVLDTLAEGVVTCQVICFVRLVEHTKCLECVSGKDEGVGGRVPDMRFYGVVVPVVVMMSCCVVVLTVVQNQVYAFRGVEYLDMRGVIHQSVHPGLLKADVADAEIGFAVSQRDKLLRNRVVCLRTGTFRDHADYREFITGNRFREVALRFDSDGNDRFRFFAAACFGRATRAGCQQESGAEKKECFQIF